jgi:hypothetical protein
MSRRPTLVLYIVGLAILISGGVCTQAGEPDSISAAGTLASQGQSITFDEFLAGVTANNLDLAAQRYNITIAPSRRSQGITESSFHDDVWHGCLPP